MTTLHFSGFPRVGAFRELKFAQEKYWRKEISEQELLAVAKDLREKNWKHQAAPRRYRIQSERQTLRSTAARSPSFGPESQTDRCWSVDFPVGW